MSTESCIHNPRISALQQHRQWRKQRGTTPQTPLVNKNYSWSAYKIMPVFLLQQLIKVSMFLDPEVLSSCCCYQFSKKCLIIYYYPALKLILTLPSHRGYGWVDLVVGYTPRWFMSTHPSSNRARRRTTSLIETNALTTTPRHPSSDWRLWIHWMALTWNEWRKLLAVRVTQESQQWRRCVYHVAWRASIRRWQITAFSVLQGRF